jgi:hypothetical protein
VVSGRVGGAEGVVEPVAGEVAMRGEGAEML